jgi:LacI family transcriptional regulator
MRVTIRKIAEIAKVSRGTVDKVLNNRPGVSDEIRQKVKEIAEALDYKPNIIGKALAYQKKSVTIGVIIPLEENPFFEDIKKGIDAAHEELKDFGVKIDYQITKSLDAQEQYNVIKHFQAKGVSALAMAVINHDLIREAIDDMVDSKIPVVTFNTDIIGSKRMCFVGHDLVKSGKVAGELMGKLLNGKGKVAIITGSHNILAHNQRIDGFKKVMDEDFSDIKIVDIVENMDQDSISFERTLILLENIADLNGIYITGAGVSGACKALKFLGKAHEVKVISFDFVPETVNLVKEGIIDFTIGQDPFEQGYKPIKILAEYLFSGQYPEVNHIQTKIDIRVKENIDI